MDTPLGCLIANLCWSRMILIMSDQNSLELLLLIYFVVNYIPELGKTKTVALLRPDTEINCICCKQDNDCCPEILIPVGKFVVSMIPFIPTNPGLIQDKTIYNVHDINFASPNGSF